jgi:hypothetical protein
MKIFDATPPPDFPDIVVVEQDRGSSARHPEAAFYLRVRGLGSDVQVHQLPGATGTGHAREMARALGFEATHWTLPGEGRAHRYS